MDVSTLQHELRRIKRRRIEIRSTKAALDMEDLNLDDRQSTVEQMLLHARPSPILPGSINVQSSPLSRNAQHPTPPSSRLTRSPNSNHHSRKSNYNGVTIKEEPNKEQQQRVVIAIEDDDSDVPGHARKTTAPLGSVEAITRNRSWGPTLLEPSDPQIKRQEEKESPISRPSKIVTLKVHFYPRQQPSSSHQPQPKTESKPLLSQQQTSSIQHLTTQPPRSTPQHKNHHTRPKSPPFRTQQNPLSPSLQPQFCPCPCLGRNRNCRTCRGTPAVIAEGAHLLLLSNTPSVPSIRHRPKPNYRINTYEELTEPERRDLELRFCRRIVEALAQVRSKVPSPDVEEWVRLLHDRTGTWDVLVNGMSELLRRRPVAREDGDGGWVGKVLVSRCADLSEFVLGVDELLATTTTLGGSEDDRSAPCWSAGFRNWFVARVGRCRDCVEACVSCLNADERRVVVDEWEVAA